jgi:hypothetical protein
MTIPHEPSPDAATEMMAILVAAFVVLIAFTVFMLIRNSVVYRLRVGWINRCADVERAEIDRGNYDFDTSTSRYGALGPYNGSMFRLRAWNVEGLVVDRQAYDEVVKLERKGAQE